MTQSTIDGDNIDLALRQVNRYSEKSINRAKTIIENKIAQEANKAGKIVAKLNRIELAKDIKHRHWANDKLRDTYLNAVIEVAEEELQALTADKEQHEH